MPEFKNNLRQDELDFFKKLFFSARRNEIILSHDEEQPDIVIYTYHNVVDGFESLITLKVRLEGKYAVYNLDNIEERIVLFTYNPKQSG